uniref:Uncharacterized protein n=1 Tax=Picea sitchensis TaxID=3332 RepID=B8LMH2_PICSI|nr:unknown [Picea sitchensis]
MKTRVVVRRYGRVVRVLQQPPSRVAPRRRVTDKPETCRAKLDFRRELSVMLSFKISQYV